MKSKVFIVGNGGHQHTLYGKFNEKNSAIICQESCELRHETKNGVKGEHHALILEKGFWQQGEQVEFNPFNGLITRVWD